MRDFFKPLRRKLGFVTLVMACVFAGAWVRGLGSVDASVEIGPNLLVNSSNGYLVFYVWYGDDPEWTQRAREVPMQPGLKVNWRWMGHGLSASDTAVYGKAVLEYRISFWYLTTPLTLLSAWLLLSKPRPAKAKAASKSAPITGEPHA